MTDEAWFVVRNTPNVTDWGPTEETRKFEIPVVVTNPDGSKTTKTVEITVQRDTDRDGDPDVTDPDDDLILRVSKALRINSSGDVFISYP